MKNKYLNTTINTDLGKMKRYEFIDKCIEAKALFWEAKREGIKQIKYFTGLDRNTIQINKTLFYYAMSKVNYKMNFCTGRGE